MLADRVGLRGDALEAGDDATGVIDLEGQLKSPDLVGVGLVGRRGLRLLTELLQLRRQLCQDVRNPQ